jgi:hypothetical protein
MPIKPSIWFHERHCGKGPVLNILIKIDRVLQVCFALRRAGHDRADILEWIADAAIGVICGDVVIVGILQILAPLIAVILPRDLLLIQPIADGWQSGWRNREDRLLGISDVSISVAAVAIVPRIVVIEEIVVSGIAVGSHRAVQRSQVIYDRTDAGCTRIRAVAIGSPTGRR